MPIHSFKSFIKPLLFFLCFSMLLVLFFKYTYRLILGPSKFISITIPKGASFDLICKNLNEKKIIAHPRLFKLYAKLTGVTTKLQSGNYTLYQKDSFKNIVQILRQSRGNSMKIVIPEGYTIKQIDTLLFSKKLIPRGHFVKTTTTQAQLKGLGSLEGRLFPSTYFIDPDTFDSWKFSKRLFDEFEKNILFFNESIKKSSRHLEDILIVASMIEKEAHNQSEMAIISDVIWKRLDANMPLGIDATTRYEKDDWVAPLYQKDFLRKTPYNTRKYVGLPPTPIASPGLSSIQAAIFPKKSPYWYYLHAPSGEVHFSRNLNEHNKKKHLYLN